MGNVIGSFGRFTLKKARRFNVESRTEKFLEKNVKVVAPKPLATQMEIEKIRQENPDLMSELSRPNPELLDRLKDVYVSSWDKPPEETQRKKIPDRPLPLERKYDPPPFGYVEPEIVTPGRLSLRQALELISKYQTDKQTNSIEMLAQDYKLKTDDVAHLVDYFKVYTLIETDTKRLSSMDVSIDIKVDADPSVAIAQKYVEKFRKEKMLEDKKKDKLPNDEKKN